ncbi:MAG TPA: tetratricopeptide repeat protein [Mycobacteriales bacterium]|jgi:tetratricopeptide (TPR) repeat protein|nr:tetratricopeptide repeat protein [Mycobacteriales bacterium]
MGVSVPVGHGDARLTRRAGLGAVTVVLAAVACGCSGGSSSTPQPSIDKMLATGLAAQQRGDLTTAERLYQQVLDIQPGNVYAHYNLGVIAQQADKTAAALGEYDAALKSKPGYVPALFNEAVIYQTTSPTKALTIYRRILALQPVSPTAQFNLGLLEARLGMTKQADADLSKAVRQDPTLADTGKVSTHGSPLATTSPAAGPVTSARP